MATEYVSKGSLQSGRRVIPPGTPVSIPAGEVKRLLALGIIAPAGSGARAGATSRSTALDTNASAKVLIPGIQGSESAADLEALRDAEVAREAGPRRTVLEAIDGRLAQLETPEEEDEDAIDDDGEGAES